MADLAIPNPRNTVHLGELTKATMSGIYFLMEGSVVVYVGQAKNIRVRVAQHLSENAKQFDAVAYVMCKPANLNRVERLYIERLVPKYNKCHVMKMLRLAEAKSVTGGELTGAIKRKRFPRSRARRKVNVLAAA